MNLIDVYDISFYRIGEFLIRWHDFKYLFDCFVINEVANETTFFDGLSVDVYFYVEGPFQYFSDLFETFSVEYKFVINPSNTILRASGVMANAGFFCLCIEVGDIFRY